VKRLPRKVKRKK